MLEFPRSQFLSSHQGRSPILLAAELGLKLLPRVFTPCWGTFQSSIRTALFVFPVVIHQSIACGVSHMGMEVTQTNARKPQEPRAPRESPATGE